MELLKDLDLVDAKILTPLYRESEELIAIFVTIVKNLKSRKIHHS